MKMSKIFAIGVVTLSLAFAFAGCGKTAETSLNENPQQANARYDGQNQNGRMNGNFTPADMMGEITAVKGSEVTLKLAEMPQFDPNNAPDQRGQGRRRDGNNNDPQNQQPPRDNQDPNQGQPPQGDNQRRGPWQGQGQGMGRQMNFTGETSTLTIPDNIEITKIARGANGPESVKLAAKDLKVGDVLQVWYSDKTSKTISRISVREAFNRNSTPAAVDAKK